MTSDSCRCYWELSMSHPGETASFQPLNYACALLLWEVFYGVADRSWWVCHTFNVGNSYNVWKCCWLLCDSATHLYLSVQFILHLCVHYGLNLSVLSVVCMSYTVGDVMVTMTRLIWKTADSCCGHSTFMQLPINLFTSTSLTKQVAW